MLTFAQSINKALHDAMAEDPSVLVCGQLVRSLVTGHMTDGLAKKYSERVITYPVAEGLMNASAMGLALAGMRPVMIHERFDFCLVGADALVNHIPVWAMKQPLPLVIFVIVGKGGGQGPQHSKDFTHWFLHFEGWDTVTPQSPERAYRGLRNAINADHPVMFVAHRELFDETDYKAVKTPSEVRLCGTSEGHETMFYGD